MAPSSESLRLHIPQTESFMRAINDLRRSEKYTDLTIECQGTVFKVHRAIVCTQSKPLAAAIDGCWTEAASSTILLDEDEPEAVGRMIDFLYTTRFDDDRHYVQDSKTVVNNTAVTEEKPVAENAHQEPVAENDCEESVTEKTCEFKLNTLSISDNTLRSPYITNAKLYILGDKYDIPMLRMTASFNYGYIADEYECHKIVGGQGFIESIQLVYDNIITEKDPLKTEILRITNIYFDQLMRRPEFKNMLRNNPDFAVDLLANVANRQGNQDLLDLIENAQRNKGVCQHE